MDDPEDDAEDDDVVVVVVEVFLSFSIEARSILRLFLVEDRVWTPRKEEEEGGGVRRSMSDPGEVRVNMR